MPHAWANINTAAALPRRRDPICTTCDIQATLCARQKTDAGAARRGLASPAQNSPLIFDAPARRTAEACNVAAAVSRSGCRAAAADPGVAKTGAGSLPDFAATVAIEDVIEAAAP
jgi:hypothetical protein